MIDPTLLRHHLPEVVAALARRGFTLDPVAFAELESRRRQQTHELQQLQRQRHELAKQTGRARQSGSDTQELQAQGHSFHQRLHEQSALVQELEAEWSQQCLLLPNPPHPTVPDGADENDNVEIRQWGVPGDGPDADHVTLGEGMGEMDLVAAARLAGSRFTVLKDDLARLHRALASFMLDMHVRAHGYTEVWVPLMVYENCLTGTGQLPHFAADLFTAGSDHYLIPTAEVAVTNLVREQIIDADALPMRYVCHSSCFRSEAGSYGRDTHGMIRQHQFEKVELVWIVPPEDSYDVLETMTGHAEAILRALELPYRVVSLCAGDMGFAASKTYDLEVWMPSQKKYREISSCSNCEAFQARRMKARMRGKDGKTVPLHTLNGSGVAVGRALVAVMENFQYDDGTIAIPEQLRPYMGGRDRIGKGQ